MKESAIARTAVYQWNKLNTTVWMLVHKTTGSTELIIKLISRNSILFVVLFCLSHYMRGFQCLVNIEDVHVFLPSLTIFPHRGFSVCVRVFSLEYVRETQN